MSEPSKKQALSQHQRNSAESKVSLVPAHGNARGGEVRKHHFLILLI